MPRCRHSVGQAGFWDKKGWKCFSLRGLQGPLYVSNFISGIICFWRVTPWLCYRWREFRDGRREEVGYIKPCTAGPWIRSFCCNVGEEKKNLLLAEATLCGVCTFSSCLHGFSPGPLVSSYLSCWEGLRLPTTLNWNKWVGKWLSSLLLFIFLQFIYV